MCAGPSGPGRGIKTKVCRQLVVERGFGVFELHRSLEEYLDQNGEKLFRRPWLTC